MPQYAMSVFALPISTCQRIEGLMNKFWWQSGGKNSSGIHWLSWKRMTKPKKFGGLGFKDIHAFNLALLGKQGWRLLTKPHSLLSKVFKARYYPKGSFLEASTGPNPSFVWRSILAAQPLIKDVIRRRVGNGEGTLIWADPWLWDSSNPRVSTPKPSFCPDFPDDWYWPLEATGCYSVKSAYRKPVGEAANTTGLTKKGVELDNICPSCGAKGESLEHVFIACPLAAAVWSCLKFTVAAHGCFVSWAEGLFRNAQGSTIALFVAGTWAVWKARNAALWEKKVVRPIVVAEWATAATRTHATDLPRVLSSPQVAAWRGLKCMVDAALHVRSHAVGVAAILLREDGSYGGAFSRIVRCPFEARVGEAFEVKEALSWLKERGVTEVALFSDCSLLIQALNKRQAEDRSYLGIIESECRLLASSFSQVHFCYFSRRFNSIAHVLAKNSEDGGNIWPSDPPACISHLIG
ncbi:unnamed protein product [Cuscuta campestris]|uniref:RNase H type-1 domain-containing protein n=1 Tax=Cuscuta campestris TaxID=132261 RepID=A0A484K546_9ASTE|nr:unnamed protein product [Cuscuta campestris]